MTEHPIFRAPNPVHRTPTERRTTPKAWKGDLEEDEVEVLPLAEGRFFPGWCSYRSRFGDSPEVEILCGGINTKTPEAAALWRQGNLLHFGFEPDPDELNTAGRDLLENAVRYIADFTEDRPIAYTPSVFVTTRSIPRRDWLREALGSDTSILRYLGPEETRRYEAEGRAAYAARFEELGGAMGLDGEGRLVVDEDLVALGITNDEVAGLEVAARALAGDQAAAARRVLERYVPAGGPAGLGPADRGDARAWLRWLEEHRPYLFFHETGGYRWYVDPLAEARGLPSEELRGPRRRDRSASVR